MEFEDVRKAVVESVREFKDRDQYLRQIDSSERNLVDRIARYLGTRIKHFDVDTEYNRYGQDIPKSLHGHNGFAVVTPDIIVHKRGTAGPNILVIEAKKNGNSGKDLEKIKAYLEVDHLRYKYGLLIDFQSKNKPILLTWLDHNGEIDKESV